MKYKVIKRCNCEDWKTRTVRKQKDLEVNEIVKGDPVVNLYADYIYVSSKDGTHYYIKPEFLKRVKE